MNESTPIERIFSFWEPEAKLPGYIRLCMRTWQKYLPEREISICDYQKLNKYLTPEEYAAVDCRSLSLPMQSDAYRCALLLKHGGIWFDADTIITPAFDPQFFCKGDFCCIGNRDSGFINGAYFYAHKPGVSFVKKWYEGLLEHLAEYRKFIKWSPWLQIFNRPRWRIVRCWNFCLNSIIDPLVKEYNSPQVVVINRMDIMALPELIYSKTAGQDDRDAYRRFWFSKENTPEKWEALERSKGIIMLHNSWTLPEFKQMNEEEFLKSDCFLAVYLKKILEL